MTGYKILLGKPGVTPLFTRIRATTISGLVGATVGLDYGLTAF